MLKIITLQEFVEDINTIIITEDCGIMEAIVQYATDRDIEFDQLVPYINNSFKEAIKEEAENKNMMKKPDGQLLF